jgi:hypothetical protein
MDMGLFCRAPRRPSSLRRTFQKEATEQLFCRGVFFAIVIALGTHIISGVIGARGIGEKTLIRGYTVLQIHLAFGIAQGWHTTEASRGREEAGSSAELWLDKLASYLGFFKLYSADATDSRVTIRKHDRPTTARVIRSYRL